MTTKIVKSVTQQAYEILRQEILDGRLRPGSRLKIKDLCQKLTLNLSAVRESLSRLDSEGLVTSEPQRGFKVAPISGDELRDLTDIGVEIEQLCLQRSIELGDLAWEANVVSTYHSLSRTARNLQRGDQGGAATWWPVHDAFHAALCAGCGSPWLLRLREILYTRSERYRLMFSELTGGIVVDESEHEAIMRAALDRDGITMNSLIRRHLEFNRDTLLEAVKNLAETDRIGISEYST